MSSDQAAIDLIAEFRAALAGSADLEHLRTLSERIGAEGLGGLNEEDREKFQHILDRINRIVAVGEPFLRTPLKNHLRTLRILIEKQPRR
jgi:hypothetical protein